MAGELRRLLVVDDEEAVRSLLQRTMTEAGYNVVTASNGQEALDKVLQFRAEVVLLDIKMPGMSGTEVLQQLTANWPEICVIIATAVGNVQTAVEAMKLGAYDYVTKPFNRDNLVLTVRRAIEKRNLRWENERYRFDLENRLGEQAERLQRLFVELVEALSREHKLIYQLAEHQRGSAKSLLSRLPPELQQPMSSVEEFSEALLRILRRTALRPSSEAAADSSKESKG